MCWDKGLFGKQKDRRNVTGSPSNPASQQPHGVCLIGHVFVFISDVYEIVLKFFILIAPNHRQRAAMRELPQLGYPVPRIVNVRSRRVAPAALTVSRTRSSARHAAH